LFSEYSIQAEQTFNRDSNWVAPFLWRSEFRNALMLYLRKHILTLDEISLIMQNAEAQMRDHEYEVSSTNVINYPTHYIAASLPKLSFQNDELTLSLVSYFLFLYEGMFDYAFHRDSILELSRVTSGELRIFPLIHYNGTRSRYLDKQLNDDSCHHLDFEIRKVDFEFLKNTNEVLIVRKKS